MIVYRDEKQDRSETRNHPWTASLWNANHRYVDFKACPELIEESLEDLRGWHDTEFAKSFYSLFCDVNRPDGKFETNDFAFGGIHANDKSQNCAYSLVGDGRIMLLLRESNLNANLEVSIWLENAFSIAFGSQVGNEIVIGVSYCGVFFKDVAVSGRQPLLNYWVFGNTEDEVSQRLCMMADGIRTGLREIETAMRNPAS